MADADNAESGTASVKSDQVAQLKAYLGTIMAKQEELKKTLAVKHDKAKAARRLSKHVGGASLRNVLVEVAEGGTDDEGGEEHHDTAKVIETPGMEKLLENYADNVDELEKELEATTKLVNEVATALAVISAQAGQT